MALDLPADEHDIAAALFGCQPSDNSDELWHSSATVYEPAAPPTS